MAIQKSEERRKLIAEQDYRETLSRILDMTEKRDDNMHPKVLRMLLFKIEEICEQVLNPMQDEAQAWTERRNRIEQRFQLLQQLNGQQNWRPFRLLDIAMTQSGGWSVLVNPDLAEQLGCDGAEVCGRLQEMERAGLVIIEEDALGIVQTYQVVPEGPIRQFLDQLFS